MGKKCLLKYLSADGYFVKTILLTVMIATICFLILERLLLLGSPSNEILLGVLEQLLNTLAYQLRFSISTKVFICKKTEDEPIFSSTAFVNELLQNIETMRKFLSFSIDGAIILSPVILVDKANSDINNKKFISLLNSTDWDCIHH